MTTLYVSDLDGTLLRDDTYLSEPAGAALARLIGDGLVFSVASARSVASMRPLLRGLRLNLPVIEFNGAFLSDLESGRHEIVNAIAPDVARDVYATIMRSGMSAFVSTFDGTADRLHFREPANDGERHYVANRKLHNDPRLRPTGDPAEGLGEEVVCLTVIDAPEPLAELEAAIAERFGGQVEMHFFENRYSPGWHWLTIHDRRASKDQAIRLLAERYDLGDHELVVFGDHLNDLKMFRIAAHAIAVANAHPELKRHATRLIGPNEEDSVVRFIDDRYSASRSGSGSRA